jgi:hypothetical protein
MMNDLFKETFSFKDSQCKIITDKQIGITTAQESIRRNREQLEDFIKEHPKFLWTLTPISIPSAPIVARLMAGAAVKANVGPMAAVAGVMADLAVKDMVNSGCSVAVVEDGGEVSAISNIPVDIVVVAGDEPLSRRLGFRLSTFPIGVATSSGRFSHALSFGDAEAVTVFCGDAGLADAAATAVCNVVKGEDIDTAITRGIEVAKSIVGVEGVLILYRDHAGTWGKIPQIIEVEPL